MTTLAPKLPYAHPFAGGYPRIGGQPLPTDPDAIDYLQRQAAVDGPVEVGVAMAVDAFVKGCKADSAGYAGDPTRTVWDALQACCIMAGARTISGALVPLKGPAPTAEGAWASGDYDRATGLKGNGSSLYLDSNYAYAQNQDDSHLAIYRTAADTAPSNWIGGGNYAGATGSFTRLSYFSFNFRPAVQAEVTPYPMGSPPSEFAAIARTSDEDVQVRYGGASYSQTAASISVSGITSNHAVFAATYDDLGTVGHSTQRAAFYSIGSSLSLSNLDTRVSTLISAIAAALS